MPPSRPSKQDFSILPDVVNAARVAPDDSQLHAPLGRTLAPASTGAINSMNGRGPAPQKQAMERSTTIRSVPSFEGSNSSPESKQSEFSSSINSNGSAMSTAEDNNNNNNNHNNNDDDSNHDSNHLQAPPNTVRLRREPSLEISSRWATSPARVVEPTSDVEATSDRGEPVDGQWDSTIGKAGMGKTGRVINKLVSDNEALKRDLQIERLRAEEAKQAAKLFEDKMDRMVNDYESRLLEANVTKTLLSRKERQVETLQAAMETEKKKTASALERESNWRAEMDKMRSETTVQVDEATSYAQLMEGRYNAIASHWRNQGDEVKRALSKVKVEIDTLVEERRKDDEKIQTLRDLCDQQDGNIKQLRREKDDITHKFDEYKQTQEDALHNIKTNAKSREDEQERILQESREALAKLKWALNVKQNVKGAQ